MPATTTTGVYPKRAHFDGPQLAARHRSFPAAKAAATALVVATRAEVDRCGPAHVYAPQRTAPEDGPGRERRYEQYCEQAAFSDCRHDGNWHTVHEGVRFLVAFCFASSEQVTVHTRPTRTASLCQQRFWKLIQKVWVVQRQLVHTRARMAINHDQSHDEIASQHRYSVTRRRPTGCSFIL